ncbi:hypothetical protein A2U01_0056131, partial [Trifolium medium]|nr:hypothetical protein [Trifolium medium]
EHMGSKAAYRIRAGLLARCAEQK